MHSLESGAKIVQKCLSRKLLSRFFLQTATLPCNQQKIVFLATLHQQIFSIQQVGFGDDLIEGRQFLLIQGNTTALCCLAHLALAREALRHLSHQIDRLDTAIGKRLTVLQGFPW